AALGICHALVTHADGTMVSNSNPAKVGETITVYAVGFGRNGAFSGYSPRVPNGLGGNWGLTFEYVSTLTDYPFLFGEPTAYSRAMIGVIADWIGAIPGYVGLYQINIKVPPAPGNKYEPCGGNGNADITFSLNSVTLYICVQP